MFEFDTSDIDACTRLNNGVQIPVLGFGVFELKEEATFPLIFKTAFDAGYRLFDTAQAYDNENILGKTIAQYNINRDELFITTKVWQTNQGYDNVLRSVDASISRLNTDYLDLLLIHWPVQGKINETWKAFEKLYEENIVRTIGVSNFEQEHLEILSSQANIKPAIDQIEIHPYFSQNELLGYLQQYDIQPQAWSPLGHGGGELTSPLIINIAEKYQKTPAQIILRWQLQRNTVVIPKSATPYRIKENTLLFDFSLTGSEVNSITALDQGKRWGPDPRQVFLGNVDFGR